MYADVATYASIGEGIIRGNTHFTFSILQSEVANMRIAFPEDVSLLDVKGKDLRDWKISVEKGIQYLDVYLNFGVKGKYSLNLIYERSIGEGSVVAQIPAVKAMGVERENGYIGIAAKTNVELAVNKIERITCIDVKQLPSSIWSNSTNPILLAFKYLNHPVNITINVIRHEELPILVGAVDSANYVTLHTQEGKVLTKATYQVRNNVKQFLRLILPKGSTLWSSFVSGNPVKPAKDKSGNILIPLEKSRLQGESLTRFPVEIVYLDKSSKMKFIGQLKIDLPRIDIPINEIFWSVYCPPDYTYFDFDGNAKYISSGRSWGPVAVQGRLRSRMVDNIGDQFSPENVQYWGKADKQETLKRKGILPIKINIPQKGQLLRFTKLLVTENESPWLSVRYTNIFEKLLRPLQFLIGFAILFLFYKIIKKIFCKKRYANNKHEGN